MKLNNIINIKTSVKSRLADLYTPIGIYLRLRDQFRDTILLESAGNQNSENSFSLSSPLSSAILGLSKKGDKPMTLSNKFTLSLASLAVLGLLAACSNPTAQTPASSVSSQQVASSASSSSAISSTNRDATRSNISSR